MDSANDEFFNESVDYLNKAVSDMDTINTTVSGISIPADFSDAATVEVAISGVNSEIKPQVDIYAATFPDLSLAFGRYIGLEKNALEGAANLNGPQIIRGLNGQPIAVLSNGVVIDLTSFKKTVSDKGTYYTWEGGQKTGLNNACDIYIPNVEKITGTVISFIREVDMNRFKNGEIDTGCISVFPKVASYFDIGKDRSRSIVDDAKNISSAFGADNNNLIILGFSQAGSLVGDFINNSDPGTFNAAVFISTKYGYSEVNDPNVKVISVLGRNEENNDNGRDVRAAIKTFEETHPNSSELFYSEPNEEADVVSHLWVTPVALKSKIFGDKNIIDYAAAANTPTSTPIIEPSIETTPTLTPIEIATPSMITNPEPIANATPSKPTVVPSSNNIPKEISTPTLVTVNKPVEANNQTITVIDYVGQTVPSKPTPTPVPSNVNNQTSDAPTPIVINYSRQANPDSN